MLVDNDEPLVVKGVGNSFEGNIVTTVSDLSGRNVIEPQPTIASGAMRRSSSRSRSSST